jgi:serine/threonine-protein kinase
MVLEKGAIFADKYEILDILATGAQATVYTALQKTLDRVVILKILSPALVANQEIVSRFEREAKLLSTLREDNVTKIYDFGKHNGVYFFVSEYIEGQSIKELLERKRRLSPQLASYIILEVSKSLSRLHKQGIIHRDLKPGNILLSQDGKVKLTDFGLAFSQALPSLTIEGSILGTLAYMPPEQILGKSVDNRSDIYSLGIVFYELLTGANPFVAQTYSAIMHNVLNLKPAPIFKAAQLSEETKDLWQIVERMIKKQAQERFENIAIVCEKLQSWFNQELNRTWELDLSDLSTETKQPILRPIRKPKPAFRMVTYIIAILILFSVALVIAINKTKKPKQVQTPVAVNLTDSVQWSSSTIISKRESTLVSKRETIAQTESLHTDIITYHMNPPQPTPPTFVKTSNVKIQVLPWATVYIDEKEIFTTPKDTVLELSVGQHNLELVNPNFPSVESVFTVQANHNLNLIIDLTERVSYLQISVTPWADIYIDDVFKVTTPISTPLIVSTGKHKITVKNPYYSPYEETIEFKSRETIEKNIILK